jgi:hypothetical protein
MASYTIIAAPFGDADPDRLNVVQKHDVEVTCVGDVTVVWAYEDDDVAEELTPFISNTLGPDESMTVGTAKGITYEQIVDETHPLVGLLNDLSFVTHVEVADGIYPPPLNVGVDSGHADDVVAIAESFDYDTWDVMDNHVLPDGDKFVAIDPIE